MIICHLTDGLGNQLFQYAAGRALSLRLDAPLKLDTSFSKRNPLRPYQLDRFNIQADSLTPFYDKFFRFLPRRYAVAKALRQAGLALRAISPDKGKQYLRDDEGNVSVGLPPGTIPLYDRQEGFDERILSVSGDIYLKGFWQSERYFAPIENVIRREFTFRSAPSAENQTWLDRICRVEAIALHVRRGDYVSIPSFGCCDLDYYHCAVDQMLLHVRHPHFFIFSDDPEWTRLHLKIESTCTYVSHNMGRQDFEDLRLMSQCKHFIIANSTFSWWGAWLSPHADKQVIAPKRWLARPSNATCDLIPDRWLQI
jgi:hypothetical protein